MPEKNEQGARSQEGIWRWMSGCSWRECLHMAGWHSHLISLLIATYCILWIHMTWLEVLYTQYLHGCLRKDRCRENLITSFSPVLLQILNQKISISRSIIPLQRGLTAQNHADEKKFWNQIIYCQYLRRFPSSELLKMDVLFAVKYSLQNGDCLDRLGQY